MDLLIELNNRIAKSDEYEGFIKWLKQVDLGKLRDTIDSKLEKETHETHSGLRDLQNIIDLYNFAKTTGNELAYNLLHVELRKVSTLEHLIKQLSNDLVALPCQNKFFEGWVLGDVLGAGAEGWVREVKDAKGQVAIVKRTSRYALDTGQVDEITAATKAGELGIGPPVYKTGRCRVDKRKEYTYILQQKLNGPTLDKVYPLDPAYVTAALDLYWTFLHKTPWFYSDFHYGNLMYDNGRIYIIDYGMVRERKMSICETLREACLDLVRTITFTAWKDAPDRQKALKEFLVLADTVSTWYFTKCPEAARPLRSEPDMSGLDYKDFGLRLPVLEELKPWLRSNI